MVDLPESCQRVQRFLDASDLDSRVEILAASTRTAQEAVDALGCTPAQIAKSVVFRAKASDRPVLVIACGDNRVDEKKVAGVIGEKIGRADADFVRARTGFVIGGVAPLPMRSSPWCWWTPRCGVLRGCGPPPGPRTRCSASPAKT
nr:YbaK/EbsC family protein [Desulfobulbus sp.]